jgi:hypothetical protein
MTVKPKGSKEEKKEGVKAEKLRWGMIAVMSLRSAGSLYCSVANPVF